MDCNLKNMGIEGVTVRTPDREAEARSIRDSSPPPPQPACASLDPDSCLPCPLPTPLRDEDCADGFDDAAEEKP